MPSTPPPSPPPPPPPPLGTLTLAELRALAVEAGFPNPDIAAAIAMAESSGNPSAVGDRGTSFGLWQVNLPAHPEFDKTRLLDPVYNAHAAFVISSGGTKWTPWTTFNTGAYLQFMPGASV